MLSLGEWAVSDEADRELVCLGLGSCVALCAYDPKLQLAGMAHMVLPDSNHGKRSGAEAKFVDLAVPLVIEEMERMGGLRSRFQIHLVGGAQMLSGASFTDTMMIGKRNIQLARRGEAAPAHHHVRGHRRRRRTHGEAPGRDRPTKHLEST